jgi:hypothetical protein
LNLPKAQGADPKAQRPGGLRRFFRDFIYGMTAYEFVQEQLETRRTMEALFMAITLGDMVGLPIMPPYYTLRLLPYVVPQIGGWKRRLLREREFTDEHEFHLHGL